MGAVRYNLIIGMLLCLAFAGCSNIHEDNEVVERVKVGDRVPAFTVEMVKGDSRSTFSTSSLTGQTVIVFFNTWCPDCQRELPELNDYYLAHKDDAGFQMIAISRGESDEAVAPFWKEHGLQIPYSAQSDRTVYELFASAIVPRVYVIAPSGLVTKVLIENIKIGE